MPASLVAAHVPLRSPRDAGRWAGVGKRLPGLVPVIPVRWLWPQLTENRLSAERASTTPAPRRAERAAELGLGATGPDQVEILTEDEASASYAEQIRDTLAQG